MAQQIRTNQTQQSRRNPRRPPSLAQFKTEPPKQLSPLPTGWEIHELRVFSNCNKQPPITHTSWQTISKLIPDKIQSHILNNPNSVNSMEQYEVKQMQWSPQHQCGQLTFYTQTAMEYYQTLINSLNQDIRAHRKEDTVSPQIRLFIPAKFAHLDSSTYLKLCLSFHPTLNTSDFQLKSTDIDPAKPNQRTCHLSTTKRAHDYWTVKGFMGTATFAPTVKLQTIQEGGSNNSTNV